MLSGVFSSRRTIQFSGLLKLKSSFKFSARNWVGILIRGGKTFSFKSNSVLNAAKKVLLLFFYLRVNLNLFGIFEGSFITEFANKNCRGACGVPTGFLMGFSCSSESL